MGVLRGGQTQTRPGDSTLVCGQLQLLTLDVTVGKLDKQTSSVCVPACECYLEDHGGGLT